MPSKDLHPHLSAGFVQDIDMAMLFQEQAGLGHLPPEQEERILLDAVGDRQLWVRRYTADSFANLNELVMMAGVVGWGASCGNQSPAKWLRKLSLLEALPAAGADLLTSVEQSAAGAHREILSARVVVGSDGDHDSIQLFLATDAAFITARVLANDAPEACEALEPPAGKARLFLDQGAPEIRTTLDDAEVREHLADLGVHSFRVQPSSGGTRIIFESHAGPEVLKVVGRLLPVDSALQARFRLDRTTYRCVAHPDLEEPTLVVRDMTSGGAHLYALDRGVMVDANHSWRPVAWTYERPLQADKRLRPLRFETPVIHSERRRDPVSSDPSKAPTSKIAPRVDLATSNTRPAMPSTTDLRSLIDQQLEAEVIAPASQARLQADHNALLWIRRYATQDFDDFPSFLVYAGVSGWGAKHVDGFKTWFRRLSDVRSMPSWGKALLHEVRSCEAGDVGRVVTGVYTSGQRAPVDRLLQTAELYFAGPGGFVAARYVFADEPEFTALLEPPVGTVRILKDDGPSEIRTALDEPAVRGALRGRSLGPFAVQSLINGTQILLERSVPVAEVADLLCLLSLDDPKVEARFWSGGHTFRCIGGHQGLFVRDMASGSALVWDSQNGGLISSSHSWRPSRWALASARPSDVVTVCSTPRRVSAEEETVRRPKMQMPGKPPAKDAEPRVLDWVRRFFG